MGGERYRGPLYGLRQLLIRASGRNLGASAIIPDATRTKVLVLRSRPDGSWGFPGGGVKHGESVEEAVARECREELGVAVSVEFLSGIYYIKQLDSHMLVFRCALQSDAIRLSVEHSAFRYIDVDDLPPGEQLRARDVLEYSGYARVRTLL